MIPLARIPSELGPGVLEVTVSNSVKVPTGVMKIFVKISPTFSGVGSVIVRFCPEISPVLFTRLPSMTVTLSGAPDPQNAAVVTSPGGAPGVQLIVANGTKLNPTLMGTAEAASANASPRQRTFRS
jgi:hypothetical protein